MWLKTGLMLKIQLWSQKSISDSNMFSQYYCVCDQINASLSRDPNILSASVRSMWSCDVSGRTVLSAPGASSPEIPGSYPDWFGRRRPDSWRAEPEEDGTRHDSRTETDSPERTRARAFSPFICDALTAQETVWFNLKRVWLTRTTFGNPSFTWNKLLVIFTKIHKCVGLGMQMITQMTKH